MRHFTYARGEQSPTYAVPVSDSVFHYVASGSAVTVTVPAGAKVALFSATADFYIRAGGTAVIPSGDVTDGTGSILNPTIRSVEGLASFSMIAAASTVITIEFYGLP